MNNAIFNAGDILETIRMIQDECLDIRTTTMGISLLDCIDSDIHKACDKVYDKITRRAEKLVSTGETIEKEYGIPIINKRIAVTPIAMLAAACPNESPVLFAKTLQRAAETCGVNFIGGYSALVHKGFSAGDIALIRSIPEALDVTTRLCSSVNVGSTKSGINMDAVKMMGEIILESAKLTADRQCVGPSKLVACDYVGIVSANKEADKMKKAGFTTTKSEFVNAPIINELPLTLECELVKVIDGSKYLAEIKNVSADEKYLGDDGEIDLSKFTPITYDPVHHGYYRLGERVGNAFKDGAKLK